MTSKVTIKYRFDTNKHRQKWLAYTYDERTSNKNEWERLMDNRLSPLAVKDFVFSNARHQNLTSQYLTETLQTKFLSNSFSSVWSLNLT